MFLFQPKTVPKDLEDIMLDAHEAASNVLSDVTACRGQCRIACHAILRKRVIGVTLANWVIIMLRILVPATPILSTALLPLGDHRFNSLQAAGINAAQALSRGFATFFWMLMARHYPIPKLLAAAGFMQLWNAAPMLSRGSNCCTSSTAIGSI